MAVEVMWARALVEPPIDACVTLALAVLGCWGLVGTFVGCVPRCTSDVGSDCGWLLQPGWSLRWLCIS